MTPWNHAKLKLVFNTSAAKGKTMSLMILQGKSVLQEFKPMPSGIVEWSYDIELPTTISLITGGRTADSTLIDEKGNIIENASIEIQALYLDGMPIWEFWLEHNIITEHDNSDDITIGQVICNNGRADLWFSADSVFHWLVMTKPRESKLFTFANQLLPAIE